MGVLSEDVIGASAGGKEKGKGGEMEGGLFHTTS